MSKRRKSSHFVCLFFAALIALLDIAPAHAQLQVNKSFSPANIPPSNTSTLTIQILNNTGSVATSVAVTDNLPTSPAGLKIGSGGLLSNSCGGTVTATPGATVVSLSGGTIAAASGGVAGSCAITVQVTANPASPPATYVNTIPASNVSSSVGGTTAPASATLAISPATGITGTKSFSPANIHGNGTSVRMTILLNNVNGFALTSVAFTDTFPTSLQLATVPNVSNSCGGTLTAANSGLLVSLTGGTIPANSNCSISADVVARDPLTTPLDSSVTNSIATNGVTSSQGARNASAISGAIRVQKAALVTKAFSPTAINTGSTSTLTLTFQNFNATAITNFTLTDAMPTNVTVIGPVSTTCTGATTSFTATSVTIANANLAAAPTGIGSTSCTLTTMVRGSVNGNFTNTVPTSNLAGVTFAAASAKLLVSPVAVSKVFSPTTMAQTGVATLTITLTNRSTTSSASITSFKDDLTTMGTGFTVASTPAASSTCGGSVVAAPGGTSVTMATGAIPIATSAAVPGTCTITVPVQVGIAASTGSRTNTIAVNDLKTSLGNNLVSATAKLSAVVPLTVSKSFSPSSVATNGSTRLTITLTRAAGAQLLTNLGVSDSLPTGFTVSSTPSATTTCTGGAVTAVSGAGTVSLAGASLGTVVANSSSCTVAVNIRAPATAGSSTNTIAVGAATATTSFGGVSNASAANSTVTVISGVTLNKSFSPTTINPNGTSRITIYIANNSSGAVALTGMALTDTLPAGLVLNSPPNAVLTQTSGTCTGTLSAVAGAGSVGISAGSISANGTCELAVDVTTSGIGNYTNTLLVGALTSTQGVTSVNTSSATLVSSGSADVSVTKTDGVTSLIAGNTTTYTAVVKNGSSTLGVAGLPVDDPQPTDMTFTDWTCTPTAGSSCLAATGTGPVSTTVTLAPGGKATFAITAELASSSAATNVTNTVTIDPGSTGVVDPDPSNNSASDVNTVTRSADLAVTKISSNLTPHPGDTVTFTVTATNNGPSDAAAVSIQDSLQSGYNFVSATPSAGSFAAPIWTIGALAEGATATLDIVATVNASGNFSNTATATSTTVDPASANNSVTITPNIVELQFAKTSRLLSDPVNGAINPKAIPGAVIEYTIEVRNTGPSAIDANTIVIEDELPPEFAPYVATSGGPPVAFVDGSPSSTLGYSYAANVTWSEEPGGGVPYDHIPAPDSDGFDANASGIRINPTGAMAPGSSFTIVYRGRLQ